MSTIFTTAFTRAIGIKYPIVQAPCAGHTTARLVAAVSNSGALGSLGCALMPVDQLRTTIREIKQSTSQPFAVNLFCRMEKDPSPEMLQQDYPACDKVLGAIRSELGIPTPSTYTLRSPPLTDQISAIIEEHVPVVSFTFGYLPEDELKRLRHAGVYVIGTATTVEEALVLAGLDANYPSRKVDAVVAQGLEAGGHRGSFLRGEELPTKQLASEIVKHFHTSRVPIPVLAAGGLSTGKDVAEMLASTGVDGVVLGTAFMLTQESGTSAAHRKIMLDPTATTRITRVLSGRNARGYPNRLMEQMESQVADKDIPSYDIHSARTKDIVAYATAHGVTDYMMLLSGSRASEAATYTEKGTLSAAALVKKLVDDAAAASSS
ncbi:2-nitropropane dioxygenase [Dichotomocladium elegans]|nr:2-nitropropane dioxygenase [Dichotomocladium elegans]